MKGARTEAVHGDAGVVDDDVDGAVVLLQVGGEGVDAFLLADVQLLEGEADGAALGFQHLRAEQLVI